MAERSEKRLPALLAESKRLARAKRRRLSPAARAELAAIHAGAEAALASGDPARVDEAIRSLEEAFSRHLSGYRKSVLRSYAEVVLVAGILAFLFRALVVETVHLDSGAMAPSLLPGDLLVVSKLPYRLGAVPERGEVLLFERPDGEGRAVKRVIGLPGETVELADRTVVVNGEPLSRRLLRERFEYWSHRSDLGFWHPRSGSVWLEDEGGRPHATLASRSSMAPPPSGEPVLVPEGAVFVMGDNRDFGEGASREEGWLVPIESIRGRVWRVLLSWGPDGGQTSGLRRGRILASPDGLRLAEPGEREGATRGE